MPIRLETLRMTEGTDASQLDLVTNAQAVSITTNLPESSPPFEVSFLFLLAGAEEIGVPCHIEVWLAITLDEDYGFHGHQVSPGYDLAMELSQFVDDRTPSARAPKSNEGMCAKVQKGR